MSILGLDNAPEQEENILKRIFWPRDQPYEADSLGQQGFWVCFAVGLVSAIVSLFTGHPMLAALVVCLYWLGGMGVREHSVTAALILTALYLASVAIVIELGRFPGILDLAIFAMLAANIRGTFIASKWKRTGNPDLFPHRMSATFRDKLIDQWPATIWPKGKYVFYAAVLGYAAMLVLSMIGISRLRAQARAQPAVQTIEVRP